PGVNRVLTALRLALLALLAFVLLTGRWPEIPRAARRDAAPAVAMLLALVLVPAARARAETPETAEEERPSPAILEELKQRLLGAPPCGPRWVPPRSLQLGLRDNRLAIAAEVHAAADGTWALPGPLGSWSPAEIRLDGAPAVAVARLASGFLHVRLSRGVHRVEVEG